MAVPAKPVGGASIESAWGGIVHDTAVAVDIQYGRTTVALAATGDAANPITFARPFASAPAVVVANNGANGGSVAGNAFMATGISITPTGFSARVARLSGTTAISCELSWIAIGPRT